MFEEITLDTPCLRIAGRRSGKAAGPKLLAVHGWLDNAASFAPLAPHFADHDLVAIDLPGHGRSSHRAPGAWYHFIDYCSDVLAVADALGWPHFALLGHSLGGAVSSMLAAALPERIERLYLIEALGPLSTAEERLPELLGQALREREALTGKQLRRFVSIDQAVAARRSNRDMPLDEASARLLVERGVRAVEGGFEWSSDPRLTLTSAMRLSESQVCGYLAGIRCPVSLVLADPPMPFLDGTLMLARTNVVSELHWQRMHGSHHLHMEAPAAVAALLRGA
ncbi:MAG: alpha/beta fold hydrolase [Xanthomonadales bacterium]|jgi:pimeloyl-ACP methyl ester carboxylesterase|nr:alpha/beta fold hydrolase [Xanthomonadales bacterium]MBK7143731.1 alpha/beta fold hydrolase [Xanthomonadales bacterium]MCC6560760.1 alpha/beta fold hydrolase [Xanthomonadales bacterium]